MNTKETTLLLASATAVTASAVASVIATLTSRKTRVIEIPTSIQDPAPFTSIDAEVLATINSLDNPADRLRALQALKKSDFWFDQFINDLDSK